MNVSDLDFKKSHELFNDITSHLEAVLWIMNKEGTESIYISPSYEKIWGRPLEGIYKYGNCWMDAIVKRDRDYVRESFFDSVKNGTQYHVVYRIFKPNGEIRWIDDQGIKSSLSGRMIGIANDITEQKLLEEELKQSNEELKHISAIISHDLKEPLRAVVGFGQLLKKQYADALDENGNKFVDFMVDGAQKLQAIVDSNVKAAEKVKLKPVWLYEVVNEAVESRKWKFENYNIKRTIADCKVKIMCNELLMVPAVINIISNVIKYRKMEGKCEMTINYEVLNDYVILLISDNGVGIKKENIENIFDMFSRGENATSRPGTGVGLFVTRSHINRQEGEIWATSDGLNLGSTFYIKMKKWKPNE